MFERNLRLPTLLFSIVATLSGAVYGQSINDDLKPATKPKTEIKSSVKKAEKATKKSARQPKQSTGRSSSSTVKSNRTPERSADNYGGSESPEQIINRYMNYQQTSGVTVRDWRNVVAQTAKTLQGNPNHSTAKAQSLIAQGQIAYNERSYPAAISYFKSALQILPSSSLPQYSLGKVYLANGQAKAAEEAFKEAIDQNEDFALAYKGMGDALVAQGENKKANKYFKKATETSVRSGSLP